MYVMEESSQDFVGLSCHILFVACDDVVRNTPMVHCVTSLAPRTLSKLEMVTSNILKVQSSPHLRTCDGVQFGFWI
jgi:hypothetical protein